MPNVPYNEVWKKQHNRLVPATFKRANISNVNLSQNTVDVYFVENPQTIIKGIPVAASVNLSSVQPGMACRVDTYGENSPNSMVVAYVVGQTSTVTQLVKSPVPGSSSAGGVVGNVSWDTSFFYICVATNTWRRVALSSF